MTATPMSPGTVLDGRYRLEVLLSEHGGARFWRATDTVLARSVAVHVVPSDDPRSANVLEAARRSAAVTDPHFLRVLDCADVDGLTWVINEWGEGVSLDIMLARGTLPAMRAAWLTREVAEAIVSAHAQGLCHGRLNPEAVIVTDSGAVKLIGFVVNAAFERTTKATSVYGDISPREADVVDLAGILYAALTGKWPGISPSSLPPAPREGRRPLRPRQVRAGVPRTLDAICDRVLDKEASQHSMPVETAHEIAAALSDFVGDPAAVAPVDAPSMHDEPDPAVAVEPPLLDLLMEASERPESPDGPESPDDAGREPAESDALLDTTDKSPEVPAVDQAVNPAANQAEPPPAVRPLARPAASAPPSAPVSSSAPSSPSTPSNPRAPIAPSGFDPEDTMATPPPFSPSGMEYFEPEDWEPMTPLPPFEQPPERPLFAEEERRVPAPALPLVTPDLVDRQPAETPTPEPSRSRRRSRLITVLLALVGVGVAIALYVAFLAGEDDQPSTEPTGRPENVAATPVLSASPSAPSATLTGKVVAIKATDDFDPEGDPASENPDRAKLATDGDLTTLWTTARYDVATLGEVSGVGLVVDLGAERTISSIEAVVAGGPTDVWFYATPAGEERAPAELADATVLDRVTGAESTAAVEVPGTRTRYVLVWLTKLPADGAAFRGQVAEITVRS